MLPWTGLPGICSKARGDLPMTKVASPWWHEVVACQSCGSPELSWPGPNGGAGMCGECGRGFTLRENVLLWHESSQAPRPALLPKLARKLWNSLNPLSNPLLPFRYLTRIRLEQYYKRTVEDLQLARKWADHYLCGLDLPVGATVLDFGCGRGRNVGLLSQLGYQVVGQDMGFHPWWRRLKNAGFQAVTDFSHEPWKNATFDLVVEVQVIHYLSESQLVKHVHDIKRLLKPGGYWLLLEGNSEGFGAKQMQSQIGRIHELNKVRGLTTECGFVEVSHSYEGFYARYFPMLVNFIRKQCAPRPFDVSDYDSWLAAKTRPQRRGLWLLRLKRSD
jgi:SAM-dependent methyltransferase